MPCCCAHDGKCTDDGLIETIAPTYLIVILAILGVGLGRRMGRAPFALDQMGVRKVDALNVFPGGCPFEGFGS